MRRDKSRHMPPCGKPEILPPIKSDWADVDLADVAGLLDDGLKGDLVPLPVQGLMWADVDLAGLLDGVDLGGPLERLETPLPSISHELPDLSGPLPALPSLHGLEGLFRL